MSGVSAGFTNIAPALGDVLLVLINLYGKHANDACPDEPDVPVEPDDPEVPDDPLVPEEPDVPPVPEEPEVPVDPDDPCVPDDPEVPEVPVVPDEPDDPLVPDDPEVPVVPDDPDDPEVPLHARSKHTMGWVEVRVLTSSSIVYDTPNAPPLATFTGLLNSP